MKGLRARLAKAGIKRGFLDQVVLPEWWEDSIALSPGGFREAAGYICAHLGYSLTSLLDDTKPLTYIQSAGVKYKKSKQATADEVGFATHYSLGVARAVAAAWVDKPAAAALPTPENWRQTLLAASDQPWVNLPHILRASWQAGIPVLNVRNVPGGFKKPDALTTLIDNRPVILVLNGRKSPSWIAFIVAHELGHIQRAHLKPGQTLVDEKIDSQANDAEESEANDYASRLLTGHGNLGLHSSRQLDSAGLAAAVQRFAQDYRVAPGVAALNYAFTTGQWAVANGAVSLVEGQEDASVHLCREMNNHLHGEDFNEEGWAWVTRATAVS